jgi:hypothetical protein
MKPRQVPEFKCKRALGSPHPLAPALAPKTIGISSHITAVSLLLFLDFLDEKNTPA